MIDLEHGDPGTSGDFGLDQGQQQVSAPAASRELPQASGTDAPTRKDCQMERHPHRYPKHDSDKGQIYGGECNRTACKNDRAIWFNRGTFGYYCPDCASRIDWNVSASRPRLCVLVEHQLSFLEMERLATPTTPERTP